MYTDGEYGTMYRSRKYNGYDATEAGDDYGNNLVCETDERGNKTSYSVDGLTSRTGAQQTARVVRLNTNTTRLEDL